MKATRFPLLILIALCAMTLAATTTLTAQTKTFRGAWFTVEYPANFTAEGSLPSATSGEDETMHVLGIHYTTQQAYNKYKKQYLQFKASLKQFAD